MSNDVAMLWKIIETASAPVEGLAYMPDDVFAVYADNLGHLFDCHDLAKVFLESALKKAKETIRTLFGVDPSASLGTAGPTQCQLKATTILESQSMNMCKGVKDVLGGDSPVL